MAERLAGCVQSDVMRTGLRAGCACTPGRRLGVPRSLPERPVNITRDWTLAAAAVSDGVVPAPPPPTAWPFGRGNPAWSAGRGRRPLRPAAPRPREPRYDGHLHSGHDQPADRGACPLPPRWTLA